MRNWVYTEAGYRERSSGQRGTSSGQCQESFIGAGIAFVVINRLIRTCTRAQRAGPGFVRLMVTDATGAADSVLVRLQ